MDPSTGTRLDPILADVADRARQRRQVHSLADLRSQTLADPTRGQRFLAGLGAPGLSIIAECKRRSPSAGQLSAETDFPARAEAYARGGASALSVLTEQDHFGGDPADLRAVEHVGLPRLRKDFLLDEAMVLESVAMGADAVLLLAVCLPDPLLGELLEVARALGLGVLVEVHDESELERALACEPDCVGVNARDLRTFEVDLARTERLLPKIPPGVLRVAESGLRSLPDLLRVASAGAHAALVGEALMRSPDPEATLAQWKAGLQA
jgi:indole-3-glycerol phosphate synthase